MIARKLGIARKSGFSMLEALVAIALAGFALVALLELQSRLIDSAGRATAAIDRATIVRNALALIKDINPASTPEGSITLPPNLTLAWTSALLKAEQPNVTFPGIQPGSWNISLYRVSVEIRDTTGAVLQTLEVDRVGYIDPSVVTGG